MKGLALVVQVLLALLALALPATGLAATCAELDGSEIDISASGSCTSSSSRAWYNDADNDGYYDETVCCCTGTDDCRSADSDPDGYEASVNNTLVDSDDYDCDETDANVNPGEDEVCDADNTDEDCSGDADDDDSGTSSSTKTTWYKDNDSDTYGTESTITGSTRTRCDQPTGYVAISGDCDDTDATINPAGTEVCDDDDTDEDCDDNADDDDTSVASAGKSTWYRDADSDGYGLSTSTRSACDQPTGYVSNSTDCNDSNAAISPGDAEICDSSNTDEDCDTAADDADSSVTSSTKSTWYRDADEDGYGVSTTTTSTCDQPTGYVSNDDDCDDTDDTVYTGATEVVGNEIDNDCNGRETCYIDTDGDGYRRDSGYTVTTTTSSDTDCNDSGEATSVLPATDCDDLDDEINPSATEIAGDNEDQDCDDSEICYYDADNDGYRLSTTFDSSDSDCNDSGEALSSDTSGDCDDTSSSVNPGRTEIVGDGVDQDCDDVEICYVDEDDDGYRLSTTVTGTDEDCTDSGEALSTEPDDDCDDEDDTVYPGASESENGVDDDCDGTTDEGTPARDLDGDCYCESISICSSSINDECTTLSTEDCDDADDTIYPGADESNNGIDDDCDGITDNGTRVYDDDGDCYCDQTAATAGEDCTGTTNDACATVTPEDCNDSDDEVNPDVVDEWYDGYDYDCQEDNDFDQDLDGYVDDAYVGADTLVPGRTTVVDSGDLPGGDCDDEDETVNPAADETWYDGYDQDCDSLSDYDQDYDGYVPNDYDGVVTYDPGSGDEVESGALEANDCDDDDDSVNPGVDETWYDGYDQDCDGLSDYDQDGDGYVSNDDAGLVTYDPGSGETVEAGALEANDCDDEDGTVNPDADEIWYDGYDQNCDLYNDFDQDGDGYVATGYEDEVTFDPGTGDVVDPGALEGGDCDDTDDEVNPGVEETWYNGIDENCDQESDYDQDGDGYVADDYEGVATYDPGTGDVVEAGELSPGECDDQDATAGPGIEDTWYDGLDADCQEDDDYDQDGDGYVDTDYEGLLTYDTRGEAVPGTGGLPGDDCDDDDEDVNPLVEETWYDGLDQNCDEASDYDQDGDGYVIDTLDDEDEPTYSPGDGSIVESGETTAGGDCVDSYESLEEQYGYEEGGFKFPEEIHPYADEECEGTTPGEVTQVDDDCDGDVNTQTDRRGDVSYAVNGSGDVYYADSDGDLFGDATGGEGLYLCEVPDTGYSSTYGDCDDSNANRHPGATELCNAIDDNCDEQVDEASNLPENTGGDEASGCVNLYSDRDNDGYGSSDDDDRLCMCTDKTSEECGEGVEYNPEDGLCYTLDNSDCYDRDSTIKPRAEDDNGDLEQLIEYIDGHDNDCDGNVPLVELDCDDDGSLPLLPVEVGTSATVEYATDLGLADCRGPDGVSQPSCCLNDSCSDDSACDDLIGIDQSVTCWGDVEMQITCDSETGFIVVSRDYDEEGTHFDGGRRIYSSLLCDSDGDCDDNCAARCPDMEEVCDGMDNDCDGAEDLLGDVDQDGIPDSMDTDGVPNDLGVEGVVPGYVNVDELDLDGDGYLGCTNDDLVERNQTAVSYYGCSTSENLGDCSNECYLASPVSEEERCNGFLDVCEGGKEGTDADRDDYLTCGAWGPEDGELVEDIYMLVYVVGLNEDDTGGTETGGTETGSSETGGTETGGTETGSSETGGTETGSSETGSTETGSAETGGSETGTTDTDETETGSSETGATDTGSTDTGSSESGSTDTESTDTGSSDSSADSAGGTDTSGTDTAAPRPAAERWAKSRLMDASDLDVGVIPLVLPRSLAPECDSFLKNRLSAWLGEDVLEAAMEADDTQPLLEACLKAEACRMRRAGDTSITWPDSCEDVTGQCTVVRLTLETSSDDDLYDDEVIDALDTEAACSEHPEQAITRTVWTQGRAQAARNLVVQWECFRLDGTFGCGDLTAPDDWASPYADGALEGGNFANADPGSLLTSDKRWWKELSRYNPEAMLEGVFAGCWGDPEPGTKTLDDVIAQDVGGDCADGEFGANRGKTEGPDDLLGQYLDPSASGDCSVCLDGIDNNCNGLTDCAEPACARCFVGQGTGCGGGSDSPCAQAGCSTGLKRRNSGVDPSGLALVGIALVALGYRWRRKA